MTRMAKRDRRGSLSPKSKARGAKKAPGMPPAKSGRSEPDHRKKLPTQRLDPGLEQPIRTPRPIAVPAKLGRDSPDQDSERSPPLRAEEPIPSPPPSVAMQSDPAGAPTQRLGTGRRVRTPLPTASQSDGADASQHFGMAGRGLAAPPTTLVPPANVPLQPLGTGTRNRTLPPPPIPGELEEMNIGVGAPQARPGQLQDGLQGLAQVQSFGAGALAKKLKEKSEQFKHIQDFLQNPVPLNSLRSKELDTSSTPEEIELRKGEVRYQIQIMQSVLAVLSDELKELEEARPQQGANGKAEAH